MKKWLAVSLLLLGACTQTTVPYNNPHIDLSGPSYRLNVARVDVVDEYQTSKRLPHVEGLADVTPSQAVRQWTSQHLIAAGRSGYAEVTIKDAHIIKKNIPKKETGVTGFFTSEQTEEYDGNLSVEIKIYDGVHDLPMAAVLASSQDMRTLGEKSNVVDRQNTYHDISANLIHALMPELDANIQGNFGKFLIQGY